MRFGFKVNKKNEIISVGLWLKNYMSQHFTSNELEVLIKKNYKLLDFLDYLVRFINYNPRILDPNAIKIHSPGSMDKYYSINTNMKELENTLKYYKSNKILRIGNNVSSTSFNPMVFSQLAGTNFADNVMMGGAAVSSAEGISQQDTHGYNLMKMYFNNVKSELAKYGKQLDENDNKFIERQIDNLKYYEDIVYNNLKTITEYVNRKTSDDEVVLGEKEIKQYANLNKFNLAKENYNLQGDQVINALLMAIDKLKPYENANKVNEAPIPLN
jgi:hypothetical protein